jgi:hypothetical protein
MAYATGKVFIQSTPPFVSPTVDQVNQYGVSRMCTSFRISQELFHGPPENKITVHGSKKNTDTGGQD